MNAASIPDIIEYLRKTNASFVKRSQVENMLGQLIDNHLVQKLERAGENGKHLYQFNGFHKLGKIEIDEEFLEVFEDCVDPITGESFEESVRRQNQELRPSMSDFMAETNVSTDTESKEQSDQRTLVNDNSIELTTRQEYVREALEDTLDGVMVDNLDEREPSIQEMLGVVPLGEPPEGYDVDGTLFDPDHEIWLGEPGIDSQDDTEDRLDSTVRELLEKGVWETDVTKQRAGEPLAMKVHVCSEDEL